MIRSVVRWLPLFCVLSVSGSLHAGEKATPDLAFVPPDATVILHARLADIWKSEQFKEWRETVSKAGEPVLAAFDKRFFPAPSSIERVTIFGFAPSGDDPKPVPPIFVFATSRAINGDAFVKRLMPDA